MLTNYLLVKLVHIAIAVIGLGTSAGLGIVLEFYGDNDAHGSFILRVIERIEAFIVFPAYLLMVATGLWMVRLSWPITTPWIQLGLGIWAAGLVFLVLSMILVRKQRRLFDANQRESSKYRRVVLLSRLLGGGFGLVVLSILYVMVFKPSM